ncbi:MAG TPA: helix-turn-helix domain-containing protein [Candidatus Limnocylindrales bacterium]
MARTRNATVHAVRRDEILDVAERLIRTRGYEAMSIQELQDELGVSRGAIYHYFGSKESILEAVIARTTAAGMAVLVPIVEDPSLGAAAKLQKLYTAGATWKLERSDLLLEVIRSWIAPANDLVRYRTERAAFDEYTGLMARIIRQGTAEGVMNPSFPDQAAAILTAVFTGTADTIRRLMLDRQDGRDNLEEVSQFMHAYEEAIERILGLPAGSLTLIDLASLHAWFA